MHTLRLPSLLTAFLLKPTNRNHRLSLKLNNIYKKRAFVSTSTFGLISALCVSSSMSRSRCGCSAASTPNDDDGYNLGYLSAKDAAALDEELMQSPGFSLEQLMELAGLSVAEAVYQVVMQKKISTGKGSKIIIVCGPGNNGGDGLVAARHLTHFGFDCIVVYPKRSKKEHFINLVKQCEDMEIPVVDEMPDKWYDSPISVIIDAIFGFSFHGEPREPFKLMLESMAKHINTIPVISIDVPSGWDVDKGILSTDSSYTFTPQVLVSLTTPKLCSRGFAGRHFVGGRFLPDNLATKYGVCMPPYPGVSQVMEITLESPSRTNDKGYDWREEYTRYLAEKEVTENKAENIDDNYEKHSHAIYLSDGLKDGEDWAIQYEEYLKEKYENELKELCAGDKKDSQKK